MKNITITKAKGGYIIRLNGLHFSASPGWSEAVARDWAGVQDVLNEGLEWLDDQNTPLKGIAGTVGGLATGAYRPNKED